MELIYVFGLIVFSYGIVESRFVARRDVSEGFKVCVEVLLLDCDRTYHSYRNETMCASNHITYSNLCHFSQARCAKTDLKIVYSGHCGRTITPPRPITTRPTTTRPRTTRHTTTNRPSTTRPTTTRQTTNMPTTKSTVTPTWPTTTAPPTTSTMISTDKTIAMTTELSTPTPQTATQYPADIFSTSPVPVTIDPALDIVKQVFCKQLIHIVCNSELDPLCGSDGNFYLNRCTFAKAECTNAKLEPIKDLTFCTNN